MSFPVLFNASMPQFHNSHRLYTVLPETALPFADTLRLSHTGAKDISGLRFA